MNGGGLYLQFYPTWIHLCVQIKQYSKALHRRITSLMGTYNVYFYRSIISIYKYYYVNVFYCLN